MRKTYGAGYPRTLGALLSRPERDPAAAAVTAMMGAALALDDPARFAGAVLLSGAIAFDAGVDVSKGRLSGVPVFLGYGETDLVIPAEFARRTTRYLREASGAALTERTYPHGHSISNREIADIRAWFEAL